MKEEDRLLNAKEVSALIGVSRTTLHRLVSASNFPKPVRVGKRASRWRQSEVLVWMETRPLATAENWQ